MKITVKNASKQLHEFANIFTNPKHNNSFVSKGKNASPHEIWVYNLAEEDLRLGRKITFANITQLVGAASESCKV